MATANYFVCLSIFRFALPLLLLVSIIFRPCVLSGIYLLFLLYLPMVPIPSPTTMKGHTGIYLKLLLTVCIINFLCQITFQILMVANAFDTSGLTACSDLERILRTVGFVEWNSMHAVSMATWITPEVIMTVGSILIFVVLRKLNIEESESNEEMVGVSEPAVYANKPKRISRILGSIGKYLTLVLICVAAVLKPSVEGGLYFLIFLSSCTWWACNKELKRGYGIVLRCLMILVFCHIFALFIYQMQWPQELLDSDDLYARLFGLTPLMRVTCAAPREFKWTNAEWLSYLNPLILILLFYILAIESTHLLKPQVERKNDSSSETTPLISGVSPTKRYGSGKSTSAILQDSTGSVTVLEDVQDDIPMQQLGKSPPEDEIEPTLLDNIFYVVESLIHIIIRSSYIATNIIMMTWSIMFHSWITFILLLWANILWMVPNQRKTMFYCSPFLVLYAWFLLLSGYIYSMDLKESELPTEVNGVDLQLIGFQRVQEMACNPLLIKCLFTVMFWITLRQFIQERKESRQNSALADMVAPLQITVGAAAGVGQRETITSGSKTMKLIGEYTKTFLTKFWIWIVAITLFGVAITGERMTCFRIIYMALFLFFIITFQLSFTVWRRVMFGFWGTVILYSMIVLILTYTYQFPNIRGYWTDYLHVSKVIQADIGLEDFGAKQLFIRLVTPTFFVIITAIQIHYFHKDFMEMSIPKNITTEPFSEGSSAQGGIIEPSSEKTDVESSLKYDLTDIASISPTQIRATFTSYFIKLQHIVNIGFLFLEIHLPKLIIFFAMLMCVYDKCAAYVVVIIFVVLSCILGRPIFLFSTYTCSILSSLMILARMIYQVGYFQEDEWNVTCTKESGNSTQNVTENNADWLGISKAKHGTTVPSLVQWNLYYIITVTLWSVVSVRQYHHRVARGRSTNRAYFIFPRIKRSDADKNVKNCIKYLLNYGYYKFGVEISLLSTVLLIAIRMDLYAMFYAFWLVILFCCTRRWLRKIWPFYLVFIGFLLALQYCLLIGLPPSLCILFSWNPDSTVNRLEAWALLIPFNLSYPAKRLLCDFIVLAFVSRQSLVFRIEARHENAEYPGGSNSSIIHHAENKDFVNPVPDFITYCRSYLDVFKRTIFLSFMWLSLAIMFLAGTNRANLFSIGYLIGSFLFLWKGSDIYLKPIDKILKSWDWLLGYNVAVILIKSMLQLAGCVYIKTLQENACWFVRLLAISCAQNFDETSTSQLLRPEDQCDVPPESAGLSWDAVCFGFLLFQRRIFNSFYFFHMVNETKAATILASRGADLIEELTQKRMREQEEGERKILEKIKAKMDRIKASQKRIQGPHYQDTNNHYVDGRPPLARSTSTSSCTSATSQQTPPAGYHTPIDDEDHLPLTPHMIATLDKTQVPSPCSAVMTVSLEGYLEPQRISFSSPPNSELIPRPPSPDDSFPVFSPPPYEPSNAYIAEPSSDAPTAPIRRQSSIGPPWMSGSCVTPRQSIISYTSRSPLSHHTYGIFPDSRPRYRRRKPKSYRQAVLSGDYYMFDELDDNQDLDLIEETSKREDMDDEDTIPQYTVGELISATLKTDMRTTLRGPDENVPRRRSSTPLARQRSILSTRSQISVPYSAPPAVGARPHSVVIIDPKEEKMRLEELKKAESKTLDKTDSEPRPGTSKDEDISELTEPDKESVIQKIVNVFLFVWVFIESLMVSCIIFLNKYSREYRYILKVLNKEKKVLKERTQYHVGLRLGTGRIWQPAASYQTLLKDTRVPGNVTSDESSQEKAPISEEEEFDDKLTTISLSQSPGAKRRKASVLTVPEIRILAPSLERGLDSLPSTESERQSPVHFMDDIDDTEMSSVDQPTIVRLGLACWYIVLSHSDILCYFIIFLNQIKSATFLSLPLPFMVFLWGTLSIPRPTKTFWVTIIAYTEVIVLIKCIFQFEVFRWNKTEVISPLYPPRIIGIERQENYALWDLLVLLIVFFHRFLLKCLGLWKSIYIPAVLLPDGDYKITREISLDKDTSSIHTPTESGALVTATTSTSEHQEKPQNSELQKLVEESEESMATEPKDGTLGSGSTENEKLVSIKTDQLPPCSNYATSLRMALSKYGSLFKIFFKQMLDPTSRVAADVYSYMFMCDFFNFFVLLIGYSSFGGPQQGDEGVQAYLEDNRVPVLFLLMLILQFALIIIDRAIFLRKYIFGKVVFQYLQIIVLHIWLFILYPVITDRGFNSVIPPQMYYMVKCFYLLLSAYQIRCGYPTRILGNFLCKGYGYVHMFAFKIFMIIPFLFELRTVMDWMWTDTSMTVFDWIKMEDIFAHIFQIKCTRHVEAEFPQPRGEKKNPIVKYLMGGGALLLMIALIWFPLVFFSLGNAVGKPNIPYDVSIDLRIGPYEPIYQMSVQSNSIHPFNSTSLNMMLNVYSRHKAALTFINNYEAADIAAVQFSIDSATVWTISPPDRVRMVDEVKSANPLNIKLQYIVSHKSNTKEDTGSIREEVELQLTANDPIRTQLSQMLEDITTNRTKEVPLQNLFPKFIKVTNRGTANVISQFMEQLSRPEDKKYRNISVLRMTDEMTPEGPLKEWWEMKEICGDENDNQILKKLPFQDNCRSLILYTFNDKIFPSQLNFITAGGIIGVYTTIVLVAGRLLRGFFAGSCFQIMFEDMPNVDRVLQLCYDVYLVREVREFSLEEDLFAKLIFLFRSPETLIKWTRPKEEVDDDEEEEEEDESINH